MPKRRTGRPRTEMRRMDEALAHLGGVRPVVQGMARRELPMGRIAEELHRLTGVRVTRYTVANWLDYWAEQEEESKPEVTAA